MSAVLVAVTGVCSYGVAVSSIKLPGVTAQVNPSPVAAPLTGGVVLTRDSRDLLHTEPDRCAWPSLTATVSATEVRLTYKVARVVGQCDQFHDYSMPLPAGIPATVDLGGELAGREVIDATTGRPVPVIAETDVPNLVTAPPGLRLSVGVSGPGVVAAFSDFGGPGSATAAEWYGVLPRDQGGSLSAVVWVAVTTGRWNPPAGTAIRPVRVRGVAGRSAAGIVVWSAGGRTYAVRWDPLPGVPMPDTATLAGVANSLVLGGRP